MVALCNEQWDGSWNTSDDLVLRSDGILSREQLEVLIPYLLQKASYPPPSLFVMVTECRYLSVSISGEFGSAQPHQWSGLPTLGNSTSTSHT
jgi:hypothetical protein